METTISNTGNKKYQAAIYVRLSKEDGDKIESDSITNQKQLIRSYLQSYSDIDIINERVDDGYSGVNFERPAFVDMMAEVRAGKINCIVVKDLSRFGRNHVEVGKYIQNVFPFLGVRFLSINDNYDSNNKQSQSDNILIPFKNLINDAYCRDISIKVRSQLEVKRKKGEYIGSFPVYGYKKSAETRNKLEVDEYAAKIVRDIFKWKLDGISSQGIADKLNGSGELSPMEYKKSLNMRYNTSFKVHAQAKWTAVAISRIVLNEVYIGVLEQGKRSTPNYKVKQEVCKQKDEWVRVENTHTALVSKEDFHTVQSILQLDTRTSPTKETVYMFSGILMCSDCKQALIRKTVPSGKTKYVYYVCSTNKADKKSCSSHSISDIQLEYAVFCAVRKHIDNILLMERALCVIDELPLTQEEVQKYSVQLAKKQEELLKYQNFKTSLYENLVDGVIDKAEYKKYKEAYSKKCNEVEESIHTIQQEIEKILNNKGAKHIWIEKFKQFQNITELTRKIIITLVEKIIVHENGKIEIEFKYQDEYLKVSKFIESIEKSSSFGSELRMVI